MMNTYKIYCLDDDIRILAVLRQILEKTYAVDCFTEPQLCLLGAKKGGCDLLITDLNMPKMDGMEMIRQFKYQLPAVPVVILTGYADVEKAKKGIGLGADEFLEKPPDRSLLLRTLEVLLTGYSILKETAVKYGLTRMQFVILQHILAGRSTKRMAYVTQRSVRTIESHRYKMMKKYQAANVMELLAHADILRYIKHKENYLSRKILNEERASEKEEGMRLN
jgi:two-component system response regulator FixJ